MGQRGGACPLCPLQEAQGKGLTLPHKEGSPAPLPLPLPLPPLPLWGFLGGFLRGALLALRGFLPSGRGACLGALIRGEAPPRSAPSAPCFLCRKKPPAPVYRLKGLPLEKGKPKGKSPRGQSPRKPTRKPKGAGEGGQKSPSLVCKIIPQKGKVLPCFVVRFYIVSPRAGGKGQKTLS